VAAADGGSAVPAAHVLSGAVLPHALSAVLPVRLAPESTFGAAWQLPASCYSLLVPQHAAATATRGKGTYATASAAAAAAGQAVWSGVGVPVSGLGSPVRGKRARVLKDGQLTMIPYGQSEAELWGQRVHSFLGAVR
jgi:hypothetical protein